jgi:predicted ribosome quality control (RQC) complex YloA/Tae2 family protein
VGLSVAEIEAVVREIAPVLIGGWVQKIHQPTPRAITLQVRAPRQTLSLFVSAASDTARLHFLTQRQPNPAAPPPFCQFLRAHIQGARLDGIEQVQGDRIVRFRMTARRGTCSLIAQLTGKRADLLLLNAEGKILAALNTPGEQVAKQYQPPAVRSRTDFEVDSQSCSFPDEDLPFPVSAALERRYQEREEEMARARMRQSRLTEIRKRIKKASRRLEALQTDLDKAARFRDHARYGELLKTNLGTIHKGQERITVIDYFDPSTPELVIPLDPSKSPKGNLDDYFKKYRKHLSAEREIRPRLEAMMRELTGLRTELTAVERGEWTPVRPEQAPSRGIPPPRHKPSVPRPSSACDRSTQRLSTGELSRVGLTLSKVEGSARAGPFRRFESVDGLPIYVGRNARENEALTFKMARSDDLWLHARGTPGSHVVVRLEKGANPLPETIKDAATLALQYSDLKKSGKGEVIYTKRKWVRKVKGQSPGTVTVTQEKTIFVQLDRARLDRLKASAQ